MGNEGQKAQRQRGIEMERQWDTQKSPRGGKGWQSGEPCAVEGSRGRRAEGRVSPQCPPCPPALWVSPHRHMGDCL